MTKKERRDRTLRRRGLGSETGQDEGEKQCWNFPIMLSAHLAASHMSLLSVNELPHRPEDDFYHMKAEKEKTKRKETSTC